MWPFKKKPTEQQEQLRKIDKRIAYHKARFAELCSQRRAGTQGAFLHQQAFHLWQAKRSELMAKEIVNEKD